MKEMNKRISVRSSNSEYQQRAKFSSRDDAALTTPTVA